MNIEECMNIEAKINRKPWYHDIKAYIKDGEYPLGATDNVKKFIKRLACQFFLSGEVLYKRNHNTTLLWSIDTPKANHLMEEMHEGLFRAYTSGPYWPEKLWEPAIIGSPWKAVASNIRGRSTIAKSIKIGRILLPNPCTL